MAKRQTFADKVAKVKGGGAAQCPKCGEVLAVVKVWQSEEIPSTGRQRMVEKFVKVCKCNSSEVFG
jgi:C4-type Zn-finger protein